MEEHAFILMSVLALQAGQEQGVKLVSEITWPTPRGIISEVPYNVWFKVVHSYRLYTTLTLSYLLWRVPEWWTVCETRHM